MDHRGEPLMGAGQTVLGRVWGCIIPPPAHTVPGGQDLAPQHSETPLRKADAGLPPSAVTQPGREGGTRSSPDVSSGFRSFQVLPSAAATHLLGQRNPTDLPDPSLGGFIPDLSLGDFTLQ